METIELLYELLEMADKTKLAAGISDAKNTSKFKFSQTLAMNKGRRYQFDCFLDLRINKPFTVNKEILIFKAN